MRRDVKTFADLHFNLRQAAGNGKGLTLSWVEVSRLTEQLNKREAVDDR
jgi:hypothetical protein